ncbi:unnamed protein product, partial [Rotaria socialis]
MIFCSQVKAVVTELGELIARIKADHKIQKIVEEPLSINIFTTGGTSTTGVNGQFVFSQILIDCLLRLKTTKADKKELIDHCKQQYQGNSAELSNLREFREDYSSEKALWWYTRESFFYKTLNAALRNQNIHIIFLFRGFISDIHRQLEAYQADDTLRVYRKPVLFEIVANPALVTSKPFADVSPYSEFADESEALFMLGSIFRLQNVKRSSDGKVWIVRMTLCSDDEHDLKQVFIDMKEQLSLDDPLLGDLYHDLGRLASSAGNSDKSMEWRQKAIALKKQKQPTSKSTIPKQSSST